ncbi:MAG: rhodanese-like domain-containing protein [Verrucomicrobiaceae bacterium]
MRTLRDAFLLMMLALVAAAATHFFHPRAPSWYLDRGPVAEDEVTLSQIEEKWKGDVLWIDARVRSQYVKGHVRGALLINEQERDQLLFESIAVLQDNKKPIIVYCDSGACQASRKIRQHLIVNMHPEEIFVLHGGWDALAKSRFVASGK